MIPAAGLVIYLSNIPGPGALTPDGGMVFFARLAGGSVVGVDNHAIVKSGLDGLSILVPEGYPAPGASGDTIKLGSGKLRVDGAGDVVFDATLKTSSGNKVGVFSLSVGDIDIVALNGGAVVGGAETAT
jgi:hypothetical protein